MSIPLVDDSSCRLELDTTVIQQHRRLNPQRQITVGEWLELLDLQRIHGRDQVLIWQGRAERAVRDPVRGILPAYYHACAAQARAESQKSQSATAISADRDAAQVADRASIIDSTCDGILQAMGIRRRAALAHVPLALLTAWQRALQHPGLAARFTDPVAFAYSQLMILATPPADAELVRWATGRTTQAARQPPGLLAPADSAQSEQVPAELYTRVAAIAPATATERDRTLLLDLLRQGATDAEALVLFAAQREHEQRHEREVRDEIR